MPYIKNEDRDALDAGLAPSGPGELNYEITRMCAEYLDDQGPLCYASLNEVIGVLECAKLELYRRVVAPYEDGKIEENGDVYAEDNVP